MERTALAAVLPVAFRWSDIGSWNAVWDAQDRGTGLTLGIARGTVRSTTRPRGRSRWENLPIGADE
jgi:mannose-1-phosphate guanylyltransferase